MPAEKESGRMSIRAGGDYETETGRNGSLREEPGTQDSRPTQGRDPLPRPAGSPLPMGKSGRPLSGRSEGQGARANVSPPGRALSTSTHAKAEQASGIEWMMGLVKQVVPFVQKLLPLLDGQVATAMTNLLAARPHTPPPPAPRVDLRPIEDALAELQVDQANFKDRLADQNAALKRVEDHLEMVREATDRNTLEQQELIEDLKAISKRVNRVALLFLGLLIISVILNTFLFLHIQRVLP